MSTLMHYLQSRALVSAATIAALICITTHASAQRAAIEITVDGCPAPSTPVVRDPLRAERPPPEFSMSLNQVNAVAQRLDDASQRQLLDMGQRLGVTSLNASSLPSDVLTVLFAALKESIQETNDDKQYFLDKLKQYDAMGNALECYLHQLVDRMRQNGGKSQEWSDLRVDASAWRAALPDYPPPATIKTPDALSAEIKKWERVLNEIKGERKHANAKLKEALDAESRVQADVSKVLSIVRK